MNTGRTIFAQLIAHVPSHRFQHCVARYRGDAHLRGFSCWDQYLAMAFAQLTYRESLRDIEACLRSVGGKLYHMGFRNRVARSTLADANERHDWRIWSDFAQVLIGIARPLYASDPIGVELNSTLYALDSTTIDLCLSLFPWAKFRQHKAAVKLHTLLDLHGNIPTFISITDGTVHDVNILERSTSSTAATSISRGCTSSLSVLPSLSSAPNPTSSSSGATLMRSTRAVASAPTTPSFLRRWNRPKPTLTRCAG